MGHTSFSCTGRTRCLVCAGEHTKDKCNNIRKQCANCKGNHLANSRECSIIKDARDIEYIIAVNKNTYMKARTQVIQRKARESMQNNESSQEYPQLNRQTIEVDVHHANNSQISQPNINRMTYRDIANNSVM